MEALTTRSKLSHEFGRTEIERFSNCRSFRSVMISLQAERRQRTSFDMFAAHICLISRCALARTLRRLPDEITRTTRRENAHDNAAPFRHLGSGPWTARRASGS